MTSLRVRLTARRASGPNGCIIWTGTLTKDGYGRLAVCGDGKSVHIGAHRAAYALHHNLPLKFDGIVCHRCDTPACINPAHLFLGTALDNNADRDTKGRQVRGERAPFAKLTAADVLAIRADDRARREIAKHYGITVHSVGHIQRRVTWRHIA
jgi:hypothetical protein